MPDTIEARLRERIEQAGSAPFLFVGSGLSRRYLGLENWSGLLAYFAAFTPKGFAYYRGRANGDLPTLASLLAKDFYDIWWSDPRFADSRAAHEDLAVNIASPLKIEIAKYMQDRMGALGTLRPAELEVLKRVVVDGVITTNWDFMLEKVFPDFSSYIGQDGLLFARSPAVAEVFKIHGCASKPNSMILTAEDYGPFEERNPCLAAKLLTIFVDHPVIFLGYSLSDPHLRNILESLAGCLLDQDGLSRLQDRLFFVEPAAAGEAPTFERQVMAFPRRPSLPMTQVKLEDYGEVYGAICGLRRKFCAKMLRQVKEQIYELVVTNDPKDRMEVIPFEDGREHDLGAVFGIGVASEFGYAGGYCQMDLVLGALGVKTLLPSSVLTQTIPRFLDQGHVWAPICKYLRDANLLDDTGLKADPRVDKRIPGLLARPLTDYACKPYVGKPKSQLHKTLKEVAAKEKFSTAIVLIPLLPLDALDLDDLFQYLIDHLEDYNNAAQTVQTNFAKLVCFYDFLRYGPPRLAAPAPVPAPAPVR